MLKDPKWDRTPSLAGFALFVASKPEDEFYNWPSCRECAVGQYLRSIGIEVPLSQWSGDLSVANQLAHGRSDTGMFDPGRQFEWTFGKLANRILAWQMTFEKSEAKVTEPVA